MQASTVRIKASRLCARMGITQPNEIKALTALTYGVTAVASAKSVAIHCSF